MHIDIESLKEDLRLTAQTDGEAYADNKNAMKALRRAEVFLFKSFLQTLAEVRQAVLADIIEDWTDESILEEARRQAHKVFWAAMDTGAVVPTTEERYEEQLNILPPEYFNGNLFAVGEPYSHSMDGEAIHAFFWKDQDGKYWAQYKTIHTRRPLNEVKRMIY